MTKQYATRLSLTAFATVLIRNIPPFGPGRDFSGTLQAALVAALAFYGIGLIFGELGRRIAEEAARNDFEQASRPAADNT